MSEMKTIESFIDVDNIFESTGYSIIRITKNGKPENMRIPITTKGVDELRRRLGKEAPFPPVVIRTVAAGSDEAERLGIDEDCEVKTFDYTEKEYRDKLKDHGERVMWETVIQGLNVVWPAECTGMEDKKNLLIKKGITDNQAVKLFNDIAGLTLFQEGREDFLHGSLSDSPPT